MSWRIAFDPNPEDPNPHTWDLSDFALGSPEEADSFAQSHWDELAEHYGEEYANDSYRWLVVEDTQTPVTVRREGASG